MSAAGGDELRDAARRRIAELAAAPATLIAAGTDGTQYDFGDLPLLFDELCKRDDLEALASLGQEFAEVAARQFDRSHDDGDVAAIACACMTTVARSLPRWNVSDAEKLLYALDIDMAFPDLWEGEFKLLLDRPWPTAAWASVAEELRRRLLARPAAEQRDDDRLQRCLLVRALENGLRLAQTTGADLDVVQLFAVLHDSRRINEITDPKHGALGRELCRQIARCDV